MKMTRKRAKRLVRIWHRREVRRKRKLDKLVDAGLVETNPGRVKYVRRKYLRAVAKHAYYVRWLHEHQPMRLRFLKVMQGLVGITEQGGNNHGPLVEKIIKENGGVPGEPWCGDTVAYGIRHCGSKVKVTRMSAAAWWLYTLPVLPTGIKRVPVDKILPGDILEYTWQHTGCDETVHGHSQLGTIEGNTGTEGQTSDTHADGVRRRSRTRAEVKAAYRLTR